ncbi:polysaccharide biosynthesis protein [Gabonibacter chumensis]|uniref:polysaccharide biosynthesis protein n=1 Tax=Gabonibacter chumensis TaxID=2972474 RepID=UPI00257382DC|nr:nucleoside-diphosphate sugar epimerase/dehydratase [Gabonibacter chumensis]MCR9012835.1 polysaccharide biosynthesis protein [Gabonibacter chumensis]
MVAFVTNGLNRMKALHSFSYTPRWIVFIIDVMLSCVAVGVTYLILGNFQLDRINMSLVSRGAICIVGVRIVSFIWGKTYSGIVRFTGTEDALRIYYVLTAGELVLLLGSGAYFLVTGRLLIAISVLLTEYVLLMSMMIVSRLIVKTLFIQYIGAEKVKKNVIICGSDEYGIMAKHALDNAEDMSYNILAFIDVNDKKAGKVLEGIKIYKMSSLGYLLKRNKVDKVIIAKKMIVYDKKRMIVETCLKYNVNVLEVPRFESWINGDLSIRHIKNIKIEDLLERGEIKLDEDNLRKQLLNKVVLVTGAAGSIGSEIIRQLTHFRPSLIVLFDQAESPLYDIELELKEEFHFFNYKIEIGDIRDKERVEGIFRMYHPDIVYHAAAYKHVPMVEMHPVEGVKTNVFGTKNMADCAVKYGCKRFVMISTDKAVNPTNVMGASKRIAEIYTQSLNKVSQTNFITTRFGNVLGSNGSVIPRFKKQIETGGPVTVTHPEITRFFMTIPEACQLVLQAGALGHGGEIFVFDMGKSVKIVDLARKMIKLSGFEVGKDIHIVFTGLRPGEKLYEEVLNVKETTLPTVHDRIKIAKVREYDYRGVLEEINRLHSALETADSFMVVKQMKNIVPEFKSKNSVFESIDFQMEEEGMNKQMQGVLDRMEILEKQEVSGDV